MQSYIAKCGAITLAAFQVCALDAAKIIKLDSNSSRNNCDTLIFRESTYHPSSENSNFNTSFCSGLDLRSIRVIILCYLIFSRSVTVFYRKNMKNQLFITCSYTSYLESKCHIYLSILRKSLRGSQDS